MTGRRPCSCENYRPGEPYDYSQCRLCWRYHNDPHARKAWGGDPEEPSFLQKALGFTKAVISHVVKGSPKVSEEIHSRRLEICHACPKYDPKQDHCTICGCSITGGLVQKLWWADQQCPDNPPRWTKEVDHADTR